jgi:hypothetical protein
MSDQTIAEKNIFSSQVTVQSDGLVLSQASLTNTFQQLTNRTRWLFNALGKIGTTPPSPLLYTNQYQLYGLGGSIPSSGNTLSKNRSESQSFSFSSQIVKGSNYGIWSDSKVIADFTAAPIAYDITGSNLILDVDFDADNDNSFNYTFSSGTGVNATTSVAYFFCNYILSAMVTAPQYPDGVTFGLANCFKPSVSSFCRAHWVVPFPGLSNYFGIPPINPIYNVTFDNYGKLNYTPISDFSYTSGTGFAGTGFPTVGALQYLYVTCAFAAFTQQVTGFVPNVYGAQGTSKVFAVSNGCPNGSILGNS